MRHAWKPLAWAALGALVLALVPAKAEAQQVKRGTAPRIASVAGVDTFKTYCAVCHGTDGRGNGPAAKALTKTPADLTGIAKRHGGTFSASDVTEVIAGAQVVLSHGTRDMPIWGDVFSALAPDQSFVKLRMANLLDYLKSIQAQ
jgi:mono/diheme cytochrome c family protein